MSSPQPPSTPHTSGDPGPVVARLRKAKGYKNQKAFAKALGLAESTVGRVESPNDDYVINDDLLLRIVTVLGLNYEEASELRSSVIATRPSLEAQVAALTVLVHVLVERVERLETRAG